MPEASPEVPNSRREVFRNQPFVPVAVIVVQIGDVCSWARLLHAHSDCRFRRFRLWQLPFAAIRPGSWTPNFIDQPKPLPPSIPVSRVANMRSVQTAGSTHAHRARRSPFKQFVPRLAGEANGWRQPYRQAGGRIPCHSPQERFAVTLPPV
jgi:hypothetical protein